MENDIFDLSTLTDKERDAIGLTDSHTKSNMCQNIIKLLQMRSGEPLTLAQLAAGYYRCYGLEWRVKPMRERIAWMMHQGTYPIKRIAQGVYKYEKMAS